MAVLKKLILKAKIASWLLKEIFYLTPGSLWPSWFLKYPNSNIELIWVMIRVTKIHMICVFKNLFYFKENVGFITGRIINSFSPRTE